MATGAAASLRTFHPANVLIGADGALFARLV